MSLGRVLDVVVTNPRDRVPVKKTDPFESAEFMCTWAQRAVDDFKPRARAIVHAKPYVIFKELNPESGKYEAKLRLTEPFPADLRGYASDALKNIRDALDQAMSAASFVVTGRRSKRTHFPFAESADDLENSLSKKRVRHCRDIPEELFPRLRAIKPYPHEGDTALKTLSLISGDHKHTMALSLGASTNTVGAGTNTIIGGGQVFLPPIMLPEKQELIIAWMDEGAKAHLNLKFPLFVAFDEPRLRETPAGDFLQYIVDRVRAIVTGLKATAYGLHEGSGGGDTLE